jgi:fructoselysine 6-kinase
MRSRDLERVKVLGIGDNVVDKYLNLGLMFPGGNALNVPVFAHRYGADAAYIGVLGNDRAGRHIRECLGEEGVDISHVQFVSRPNRYARVTLVAGERVFLPGRNKEVTRMLALSATDYEFMRGFDVVHTSVHSFIDDHLQEIRAHSRLLSYDYSGVYDPQLLAKTLPHVDCAFFSGTGVPLEEIRALQKQLCEKGPRLVMVTRGAAGAILYLAGAYYEQDTVATQVADTLGAGDAFIARFLVGLLRGEEVRAALRGAAEASAAACQNYGAFGYGIPCDADLDESAGGEGQ